MQNNNILSSGKTATDSNFKKYRIRWLLPLIFVFGFIITFSCFDEFQYIIDYLILNVFSFLACCLLLTRLGPPLSKKLPIWIIFLYLLLFYFLKFYLLFIVTWDLPYTGAELLQRSDRLAVDVFKTTSYAFIVFCITAWFLLKFFGSISYKAVLSNYIRYNPLISFLKKTIPLLMVLTASSMYIYNIKAGGYEYLPFHLAGWTVHSRTILIPGLLLLLIHYSMEANQKKNVTVGIVLLFLHGVSEVLLKTSKAALLFPFLMLAILLIITGHMTKKYTRLIVSIILITLMLFPVIQTYRGVRIANTSITSSLGEALITSKEIFSYNELIVSEIAIIVGRFIGAETLTYIVGAHLKPLYAEAFTEESTVSDVMKVEVMGMSEWMVIGISSGLLGWFYLVGGSNLVCIGICVFTILVWLIWRGIAKSKLYCTPVAQTLFLLFLITTCSEGVLNRAYLEILIIAGSIAVCEWIVWSFKKKKRLTSIVASTVGY
jgi:hypothetical protein